MLDIDERHPRWITRLRTDEYAPVAWVHIKDLAVGDIVNVRDLGFTDIQEEDAFLTIDTINRDAAGLHGFGGKLPHGDGLKVIRGDGVPMTRRRVVRYVRHASI
jgi:hypothetical protein